MKQNPLDNTFYNALQEAQTQIGRNIINSKEDDENSPIPRINNSPHTAGITDQVIADRNQEPINHTKPESPKETITMEQNSLDNTRDNVCALQEAQTQIGGNIINSQEDDENSPIPRINNSPHTAGITDQVIADRNPEPINHTKPESPKETITMGQNSLDNTRDNVCALQNVQSKTEEYTINNQEGYKLELRNSHLQIEGDIINQEQPEKTDPVNAYQNPEPMSQSILSLLEKKILEQKRFSREREKEIVKKNNNKNLERSFVDVRKDADIVVSPDVGTKIENRKYKFIKPINCMTYFHARSLQIRKIMEIESSVLEKDILELESLCSPAKVSMKLNAKSSMNSDPDTRTKRLRYVLVFELVKNMSFVDGLKDAAMHNLEPLKNIHNISMFYQEIFSSYSASEMFTKITDTIAQNKTNLLYKFERFYLVAIKLSKFSNTYPLKTQLTAFVNNAVRTGKPVTTEMLREAASAAGLEIENLFLRNSNSQSITTEDLTYVIYFPDDCRYPILIPIVRGCYLNGIHKTAKTTQKLEKLN